MMEFKKPNRYNESGRNKITVPQRGDTDAVSSHPTHSPPADKVTIPTDLASQRQSLGFDDIPIDNEDMEHVRFRDIIGAWIKQTAKNSPLEKRLATAKTKKDRLREIKNDLKWALQADLDEPVAPQQSRPQIPSKKAPTHKEPEQAQPKTIDINISLGSLPKISSATRLLKRIPLATIKKRLSGFRFNRRNVTFISIGALLLASFVLLPQFITKQGFWTKADTSSSIGEQQPQYTTITPSGKNIDSLGGWKRVSPPDRNAVFAYADKIGNVSINVSQQPIPDSFKPNQDEKVQEVAKGFNASDKIVADGTTIYIGTSSKGPQSVITSKGDLLILIKSTAKIDNSAWGEYVKSLH